MVAYWLFARGQDDRLHSPVRLYSFLQKPCVLVLEWEDKCKNHKLGYQEATKGIQVAYPDLPYFEGTELLVS